MPKQVSGDGDAQERSLLALLNSTPTKSGTVIDLLADRDYATGLARDFGGRGTHVEVLALSEIRGPLQDSTLRGIPRPELDTVMANVVQRPQPLSADGLRWALDGPAAGVVAARAVIAWAHVTSQAPGRLRPCGNDDCRLFFIDHSKGNTARWCSMATCGNRMKARRHHARRASS